MSFYVLCQNSVAFRDISLKSKYEVALVDYYFQRNFGFLTVYYEKEALFRISLSENDSIDDLNSKLDFKSRSFPQLKQIPTIKLVGNMLIFNTRSDHVKFKFSEEARVYFKLEGQYYTKKQIEWLSDSWCHIVCDIVSEQLIGSRYFQVLRTLKDNSTHILFPQYVDVQRTCFESINISVFNENLEKSQLVGPSYFKLHFRPK